MFVEVLDVVGEVLAEDANVGVVEEGAEEESYLEFLMKGPVRFEGFGVEEWDANCLVIVPSEADAIHVAGASFYIDRQIEPARVSGPIIQVVELGLDLRKAWLDSEVTLWLIPVVVKRQRRADS